MIPHIIVTKLDKYDNPHCDICDYALGKDKVDSIAEISIYNNFSKIYVYLASMCGKHLEELYNNIGNILDDKEIK